MQRMNFGLFENSEKGYPVKLHISLKITLDLVSWILQIKKKKNGVIIIFVSLSNEKFRDLFVKLILRFLELF